MAKKIALVLVLVLLASMLAVVFVGCGKREETLRIYNWGEYIDMKVVRDFEKLYNVRVNYKTFDSNEDLYAKISGGASGYDVIFPSDYMVERLIAEDLLLPIDLEATCEQYGAECYYDNITEDFRGHGVLILRVVVKALEVL